MQFKLLALIPFFLASMASANIVNARASADGPPAPCVPNPSNTNMCTLSYIAPLGSPSSPATSASIYIFDSACQKLSTGSAVYENSILASGTKIPTSLPKELAVKVVLGQQGGERDVSWSYNGSAGLGDIKEHSSFPEFWAHEVGGIVHSQWTLYRIPFPC